METDKMIVQRIMSGSPESAPDSYPGAETPEEAASVTMTCDVCSESGYIRGEPYESFTNKEVFNICTDCGSEIAEMFVPDNDSVTWDTNSVFGNDTNS